MKKFVKFALLAALIVSVFASMAFAYPLSPKQLEHIRSIEASRVTAEAGESYTSRGEKIIVHGDMVYGLAAYATGNYPNYGYKASEILVMNKNMELQSTIVLQDGEKAALNATNMILFENKLYVAAYGGSQSDGTMGDIWVVDVSSSKPVVKQGIDASKIASLNTEARALPYGISIIDKDNAYLLFLVNYKYGESAKAKLYKTTVSDIESGNLSSTPIEIENNGTYWGVRANPTTKDVWVSNGTDLIIYSSDLKTIKKTLKPADLGSNIMSFSFTKDGAFYAAADYIGKTNAIGTIANSNYSATKAASSFGTDLFAFTFKDNNDNECAMLADHFASSSSDSIYIWNDLSKLNEAAAFNFAGKAVNVHGAASDGKNLYLATYDNLSFSGGAFVALDIASGYNDAKTYEIPAKTDPVISTTVVKPTLPSGSTVEAVLAEKLDTDATKNALVALSQDLVSGTDEATISTPVAASLATEDNGIIGDKVTKVVPIPIVSADATTSGTTVALGFQFSGSTLKANGFDSVSDIQVLKIQGKSAGKAFEYVSSPAQYEDGCFTILDGSNNTASGAIGSGTYTLVLFVRDNGDFDLHKSTGDTVVIDPAALVKTTTENPGSSGSSSCSAGAFGLVALAALGALTIKRRQR